MRRIVFGVLLGVGLWAGASTAEAQGVAGTLRELQLLVRPGEKVTVTDTRGHEVRGRIETLTSSALVIEYQSERLEWTEAEITSVRQVRNDSLANGALIGLAAGAGFGLVGSLVSDASEDDSGWVALATAFYGGLGAGIGVGVDAMIRKESVIFRPMGLPRAELRLVPLVGPSRQGVLVSLRF